MKVMKHGKPVRKDPMEPSFGRLLGRKRLDLTTLAYEPSEETAEEKGLHEDHLNQSSGFSSSCFQRAVFSSKINLDPNKLLDGKRVPFLQPTGSSSLYGFQYQRH
jgi:hypothetical protein